MIALNGASIMDIHRRTGISHETIRRWLKQRDIHIPSVSGKQKNNKGKGFANLPQVCQMYKDGWRTHQIAKEVGISTDTVTRWLRKGGVKILSRRKEVDDKKVIKMYLDEYSVDYITNKLGCGRGPVKRVLRENNIPMRTRTEGRRAYENRMLIEQVKAEIVDENKISELVRLFDESA